MSKILLKYFVVKVTVRDNAIENCPQAKGKPLTVVMDICTYISIWAPPSRPYLLSRFSLHLQMPGASFPFFLFFFSVLLHFN